ncbi:sugar ABC transporter permease [Sinomonas sp. ASV322]|uniref:carbohydrate ABC transporter permease n=1 Tax=Sinomonas sp. ASV322 TaxID=3041920 RepID=UPI0027DC8222|nr:sugar ABC transporter permease [Sinomonas sp. ASV322]MDQ4504637.1 sugar ABC transporter permease [Sinomonas sp. ASV322]
MTTSVLKRPSAAEARPRRRGPGVRGRDGIAGWLFTAPVLIILGLFLVLPILMAAWVSVSSWNGLGSPFQDTVKFVGGDNYAALLAKPGLAQTDFGTSLRNNGWYVLLVVPIQTAVSLFLAILVNQRVLAARSAFRTAFYFPSVTSSVAITVIFLFLFSASGTVNAIVQWLGGSGVGWFADTRGVVQQALGAFGVHAPSGSGFLGLTWFDWISGPSPAMLVFVVMAIFTTSGTFMLIYLAALQQIARDIEEATIMDGANAWQRFRYVTLPMLRPTTFTVMTLGLIGTWQIFDQIYVGSKGGPAKTTLTPAFLSYSQSFINNAWGRGAAIAFILFAIIVVFTLVQRVLLAERGSARKAPRRRPGGRRAHG